MIPYYDIRRKRWCLAEKEEDTVVVSTFRKECEAWYDLGRRLAKAMLNGR